MCVRCILLFKHICGVMRIFNMLTRLLFLKILHTYNMRIKKEIYTHMINVIMKGHVFAKITYFNYFIFKI